MPTRAQMEEKGRGLAAQRQQFEMSEQGRARMTGLTREHTSGASVKQYYHHMGAGVSGDPNAASTEHHAQQLPGMEAGPVHAPVTTAWHALPEEEKQRTMTALRTHAGVDDISYLHRAYGAQLDQGTLRGIKHGQRPYASDFYEPGSETGRKLTSTAREKRVPYEVHTAALAMTSNQTTFKHPTSTIAGGYFNNALARSAVSQAQLGVDPRDVKGPIAQDASGQTKKVPGLRTSVRRATQAVSDIASGRSMQQVEGFGPKTGPFHNAFHNTIPGTAQEPGGPEQRLVGDVHTLGGGFLPHLGTHKELVTSASGKQRRDKSQREKAIEKIPHFHELADHVARQVHAERGITNTGIGQATQWGEEQIRRKEQGAKTLPTERQAYPHSTLSSQQFHPDQGAMFRNVPGRGERPRMSATPEHPPNQWTPGSPWTF